MCGQLNLLSLTLCNDFTLTSPISHNFHSAPPPTPLPANSPPGVFLSPYHHEQLIYIHTTSSMSGFTPTPVCWQHSVNPSQYTPTSDTTCNSPTWYDFISFPHQLLTPHSHDAGSRPGFAAILIHRWHLVSHFWCTPASATTNNLSPWYIPSTLPSATNTAQSWCQPQARLCSYPHPHETLSQLLPMHPHLCHHWQLAPLVWSYHLSISH